MSKLAPLVSSGILRPVGNQVVARQALFFSALGVLGGLPGVLVQFEPAQYVVALLHLVSVQTLAFGVSLAADLLTRRAFLSSIAAQ